MSYELVLTEDPSREQGKAYGRNVFLQDLPEDSKVYLFYYPGAAISSALEDALRTLGETTGANLFVNVGRLDDPEHDKIVDTFGIRTYPVIVMTADSSLSSPDRIYATAFVRLDSKSLIASPERTVECVQKIFNLFLKGEILEAMSVGTWTQRTEMVRPVGDFVLKALKGVLDYIKEADISFSFVEGKLELKPK